MTTLRDIPELAALNASGGVIRIPPEIDVPLTPRVRQLVDSAEFRRLAHISQLGLVSLVYPAANHSRFEHSLGVYRNALHFLNRLAQDERFSAVVKWRSLFRSDPSAFLPRSLPHFTFTFERRTPASTKGRMLRRTPSLRSGSQPMGC